MAIPVDKRTKLGEIIGVKVSSRDGLKAKIVRLIDSTLLGYMALMDLSRRYNRIAASFGIPEDREHGHALNGILKELEAEGLVALRYFDSMNKTYIFSEARYLDIEQEIKEEGRDIWAIIEQTIRTDEKAMRKG